MYIQTDPNLIQTCQRWSHLMSQQSSPYHPCIYAWYIYPPGNDHISPQNGILSRWFSELPKVGYVNSLEGTYMNGLIFYGKCVGKIYQSRSVFLEFPALPWSQERYSSRGFHWWKTLMGLLYLVFFFSWCTKNKRHGVKTRSFRYRKRRYWTEKKAILGMGFPLHKPYPYSLYRWVHPFLVPKMSGEGCFVLEDMEQNERNPTADGSSPYQLVQDFFHQR